MARIKHAQWFTGAMLAALALPAQAAGEAATQASSAGQPSPEVQAWQAQADRGDAEAQYRLAQAYRQGQGVTEDLRKAEFYYAKAASQGHVRASDDYGLLLFHDGRRSAALPYVKAAAERGDPRAEYLLGLAHFNGDLVPRDWVRAYALISLSNEAGLPQSKAALAQMDQYVSAEQRLAAKGLADKLKLAAAGGAQTGGAGTQLAAAAPRGRNAFPAPASASPSAIPASSASRQGDAPGRVHGTFRPVTTRNAPSASSSRPAAPARPAAIVPGDGWRIQLGAFANRANAERLRRQIGGMGALAGKGVALETAGPITRVVAVGFGTQGQALSVCASLKRGGQPCLVMR